MLIKNKPKAVIDHIIPPKCQGDEEEEEGVKEAIELLLTNRGSRVTHDSQRIKTTTTTTTHSREGNAYYDLSRVDEGLLVEYWDVLQSIPAPEEFALDNGKFYAKKTIVLSVAKYICIIHITHRHEATDY